MQPEPVSPVPADGAAAGSPAGGAPAGGSSGKRADRGARDRFPPTPKSVRIWSVPGLAGKEPELPGGQASTTGSENKPVYKSHFTAIAFALVFLAALLVAFLVWRWSGVTPL